MDKADIFLQGRDLYAELTASSSGVTGFVQLGGTKFPGRYEVAGVAGKVDNRQQISLIGVQSEPLDIGYSATGEKYFSWGGVFDDDEAGYFMSGGYVPIIVGSHIRDISFAARKHAQRHGNLETFTVDDMERLLKYCTDGVTAEGHTHIPQQMSVRIVPHQSSTGRNLDDITMH